MKIPKIDTKPFTLFLDLDGVFAHFDKRVFDLSGKWPSELGKKLWKYVMSDKVFFQELELMPDSEHLWEYSKQYDPIFLTGSPPGDSFKQQKKSWVEQKFGKYEVVVLPRKDKPQYSGWNKVLVDDNSRNIGEWTEKGGTGILHKNPLDTINQLEALRKSYEI